MIVTARTALRHEMIGDERIITSSNSREHKQTWQHLEQQRQDMESRIIDIDRVAKAIFRAMAVREGFSFIRLGDSELLALAQELIFPINCDITEWGPMLARLCCDDKLGQGDRGHGRPATIIRDQQFKVSIKHAAGGPTEVKRWANILRLSGIDYPDLQARDYMQKALAAANIIGVPTSYRPGRSQEHLNLLKAFQTIFLTVLDRLEISLNDLILADSAGHHLLHARGWLRQILLPDQYPGLCERFELPAGFKPRLLLIGNLAPEFQAFLLREGGQVVGAVYPVGIHNTPEVLERIRGYDFDLALVSAGTAAKYICTTIAGDMGKIAIDTGQLFNTLLFEYQHMDHHNYVVPYISLM
ncbi:MAG: hypothetical protein ACM3PE_07055 [Deltaproteobacteria bacterium]